MKIDRDTIRHLETLARITLPEAEVEAIAAQLVRIVDFVRQLQAVDTEGVEPTGLLSQDPGAGLRADAVLNSLDRADALAQAPDAADGYFRVPHALGDGKE